MAIKHWHREEPREVRPFFEALKAEDALEKCSVTLFSGMEASEDTAFDLDGADLKKLDINIYLSLPDPGVWIPSGISEGDIELVLLARHPLLKRSEVVQRAEISGNVPPLWNIEPPILERFGGGRNLQLTLALCLREDREPAPGIPFLAGHWLARKIFLLRSRTTPNLFDVRTRTDEDWIVHGMPSKTLYSVDYNGGINEVPDEGASVATVWVHIDAHNRMVSSPLGEALQPFLASEILTAILVESVAEWKDSGEAEAGTALSALLKQLGQEKPMTIPELKTLVSSPSILRATVQDRLSVVSALK